MKKKILKVLLASLLVLGLAGISNATTCDVDQCNNEKLKSMVFKYRELISGLKLQKREAKPQIQLVKQADILKVERKAEIKENKELITDIKASITGIRTDIELFKEELYPPTDMTPAGNNPVPEPATMLLFGAGIAGIAGARLRKKNR